MLKHSEIKLFPKAELHCHLDGSIRPKTLQKIAAVQGLVISDDLEEVASNMQAPRTCKNLEEYLTCFDYVLPYLQTETSLEMAAYDVMEQAAEDGIRYIEIRFAPTLSMRNGLSVEQTVKAVATGIAKAEREYPVYGNILVIGMRSRVSQEIVGTFTKALSTKNEKIVGFDLAGAEKDLFVRDYEEAIEVVTSHGNVALTLHAGECGCIQNMYDAIEAGATRLGHGIAINGDEKATAYMAKKDVCIESCPTSNVQTRAIDSLKEYPMREWLEKGVTFCINTDNKTVSNTTLSNEYHLLVENHDLTTEELRELNQNAVSYSFAKKELKEQLLSEMTDFTF
ncbi:adenosine deaminase [Vagococcus fluvialis]|uniref:adenosine deaminase n=1 Tax=Vagococcus fluvialis TaxID=2738 RepID=UPI003B5C33D5